MSKDWLNNHIDELPAAQKLLVRDAIRDDNITLLKADVTNVDVGDVTVNPRPDVNGTVTFKEITFNGTREVDISTENWTP